MRERWGTFSVRDHLGESPFVSDVLLFDRLVIPVPDASTTEFWRGYDPVRQEACLKVLGVKTNEKDGLALTVPWNASKRERFKSRMSTAAALATQQRTPDQAYYLDPFEMTRQLVKDEFLPALPTGVSKAWTVAAYASAHAFRDETQATDPQRRRKLASILTHRFLAPTGADPKQELLKRAVDLATTDAFRMKRSKFYEWQEEVIEEGITPGKAIEEMEERLKAYNAAINAAFKVTLQRYAFTVIPISIALGAAIIAGPMAGVVLAGSQGLVQLTRFYTLDRKPTIAGGDLDAAAMIHDAQQTLALT